MGSQLSVVSVMMGFTPVIIREHVFHAGKNALSAVLPLGTVQNAQRASLETGVNIDVILMAVTNVPVLMALLIVPNANLVIIH